MTRSLNPLAALKGVATGISDRIRILSKAIACQMTHSFGNVLEQTFLSKLLKYLIVSRCVDFESLHSEVKYDKMPFGFE